MDGFQVRLWAGDECSINKKYRVDEREKCQDNYWDINLSHSVCDHSYLTLQWHKRLNHSSPSVQEERMQTK